MPHYFRKMNSYYHYYGGTFVVNPLRGPPYLSIPGIRLWLSLIIAMEILLLYQLSGQMVSLQHPSLSIRYKIATWLHSFPSCFYFIFLNHCTYPYIAHIFTCLLSIFSVLKCRNYLCFVWYITGAQQMIVEQINELRNL